MPDVDPTVRALVESTLAECDQEKLDTLIFELVLSSRIDAGDLQRVMEEQIHSADQSVKDYWHDQCTLPECQPQVEKIGLLRFKLPDGREEDYGWTGEWPPPYQLERVTGQLVPEEVRVAIALPEDLSDEDRAEMVVTTYRQDTQTPLDDHPYYKAAAVYVLDGHQK